VNIVYLSIDIGDTDLETL